MIEDKATVIGENNKMRKQNSTFKTAFLSEAANKALAGADSREKLKAAGRAGKLYLSCYFCRQGFLRSQQEAED